MSGAPVRLGRPPRQWLQLWLVRTRVFLREPGVLFWVFGFPILLAMALGVAFRHRGPERSAVVVARAEDGSPEAAERAAKALEASPLLAVRLLPAAEAEAYYRRGGALVLVRPGEEPRILHNPARPGAPAAAAAVVDALERASGRRDLLVLRQETRPVPGRRYIDFLIPGLLGMGLLSGGIWGVGYDIVNHRVKRLLKRMVATPMDRRAFLASFLLHRLTIAVVETGFLLAFAAVAFGVRVQGSLAAAYAVALAGALSLAGLGLLVGCRARNLETANGLMNLASLPMWVLSGVFFPTTNFPDWMRPVVAALPLTALNDALRAIMNDGAALLDTLPQIGVLAGWGAACFLLALRLFRWQ